MNKAVAILLGIFFLLLSEINSQSPPITLIFGGYCTFSDHYAVNTKPNEIHKTFENIPWMKDVDVTMMNLESCISTRGTKLEKEFNFRMHPKYLPVL